MSYLLLLFIKFLYLNVGFFFFFFFQAEDGIRDGRVTGVQTCALPISSSGAGAAAGAAAQADHAAGAQAGAARRDRTRRDARSALRRCAAPHLRARFR